MKKYEKAGFTIIVTLNDEFSVRANIIKLPDEQDTYDFTLEIANASSDLWMVISDEEVYRMESQKINSDVADYILRIYKEGYFSPIINNYIYREKCEKLGELSLGLANMISKEVSVDND